MALSKDGVPLKPLLRKWFMNVYDHFHFFLCILPEIGGEIL